MLVWLAALPALAADPSPVDACRAAIASPPTEARDAWGAIASSCGPIYRKQCADAWAASTKVGPEARIATVVDGCRAAYCPDLPAPKPSLCTGALDPSRYSEFSELNHRILAFEGIALASAAPRAPGDLPIVSVQATSGGWRVGYESHSEVASSAAELKAAFQRLLPAVAGARVELAVGSDVPAGVVRACMDDLDALGKTDVRFTILPPSHP